ncbi:uncharacterized [Tachysurus ichikawai]
MMAFHYEEESLSARPVLSAQPGSSHLKELCQWVILNEMPGVIGIWYQAASSATTHFRLANVKGVESSLTLEGNGVAEKGNGAYCADWAITVTARGYDSFQAEQKDEYVVLLQSPQLPVQPCQDIWHRAV